MSTRAREGRHCVILGHRLEVYPSDDHGWSAAVDGEELLTFHACAYAAWAVGAAESYRLGRVAGSPIVHD